MDQISFEECLSYLLGLVDGRVEVLAFTGDPWSLSTVITGTLISRHVISNAIQCREDAITIMIESGNEFQMIMLDRDRFQSASLDEPGIMCRFEGVEFEIRPLTDRASAGHDVPLDGEAV